MATDAAAPPLPDDLAQPGANTVWISRGSLDYQRASLALFLAGFASFSAIYCVQPLLPDFARHFHVSPAQSSLALSLATGLLAISIVVCGAFSQSLGRKGLMFISMALASALNIAAALSTNWHGLLATRALDGLVLGGVPAVAMAYLAEEIEPRDLGRAMGVYIAGTALGGMTGRVAMGVLTEFTSWRVALGVIGGAGLLAALGFLILLPRSRNFVAQRGMTIVDHLRLWRGCLANPSLLRIYATGFLLMSIFVTVFNYATFRLSGPPFSLGPSAMSMIFLVQAFGIVSSTVSGALIHRLGRGPLTAAAFVTMLAGIALTLVAALPAMVIGVILLTSGFFIGHAVASSSVGPLAGSAKGHAASLYLLFYYVGSSVTGSVGGWFWQHGGWPAIVVLTGVLCLVGLVLSGVRRKA